MNAVSNSKRKYGYQDLLDYAEHHGVGFQFTSHFPLHSLLSLRVMIVNSDDRLRKVICKFSPFNFFWNTRVPLKLLWVGVVLEIFRF